MSKDYAEQATEGVVGVVFGIGLLVVFVVVDRIIPTLFTVAVGLTRWSLRLLLDRFPQLAIWQMGLLIWLSWTGSFVLQTLWLARLGMDASKAVWLLLGVGTLLSICIIYKLFFESEEPEATMPTMAQQAGIPPGMLVTAEDDLDEAEAWEDLFKGGVILGMEVGDDV